MSARGAHPDLQSQVGPAALAMARVIEMALILALFLFGISIGLFFLAVIGVILTLALRILTAILWVAVKILGGVDSRDSLLGANQIQGCFWGGSLGCDGTVGFERRGVGADSAADHRPA